MKTTMSKHMAPTLSIRTLADCKEIYLAKKNINISEVKKKITERMKLHDQEEKEKEERLKNAAPDEDGWVVVQRVGKNKGAPRTEAEDQRVKLKEGRKRKRKELTNFYAFQANEIKRQKIESLRQQFDKDKSKIESMKAERKFKPF